MAAESKERQQGCRLVRRYQGDVLPGRCLVGDAAWLSHAGWRVRRADRQPQATGPAPSSLRPPAPSRQPPGCPQAALLPGSSKAAETDVWSQVTTLMAGALCPIWGWI